ncbi:MAG: TonB family protein [Lewinellaceae bacterium]|nr:TonB family protein [Lewinellaceae bacterium]
MKKYFIFLPLAILFSIPLVSQNFEDYYRDQLEVGSKLIRASYHQTLERTADGFYLKKVYYPEKKQKTHLITYIDKGMKMRHGAYAEWFDNGKKWKEGSFKNDKRDGLWTTYSFDHGKPIEYGYYLKGEKDGRWTDLDSLGRVVSETEFVNGKEQGEQKVFDANGAIVILRVYEKGELVSEKEFEGGPPLGVSFPPLDIMPYLKECAQDDQEAREACSTQKMLETIYKNIHYPAIARENGLEGMALFRFVVDKEGKITDLQTMRGLCRDIENECLRVISLLPEWAPGEKEGVPVKVQYNLPVKFRLE